MQEINNKEIELYANRLFGNGLTKTESKIFSAIARNQRQRGFAFFSKQTLAKFLCVGTRTVEKATRKLKDLGLVDYFRGKDKRYQAFFRPLNEVFSVQKYDAESSQKVRTRFALDSQIPLGTIYTSYSSTHIHNLPLTTDTPKTLESQAINPSLKSEVGSSLSFCSERKESIEEFDNRIVLANRVVLSKSEVLMLNEKFGTSNVMDAAKVLATGYEKGYKPRNGNWLPQMEAFLKKRQERQRLQFQNTMPGQIDLNHSPVVTYMANNKRNAVDFQKESVCDVDAHRLNKCQEVENNNKDFINAVTASLEYEDLRKACEFRVFSGFVSIGSAKTEEKFTYLHPNFKTIVVEKLQAAQKEVRKSGRSLQESAPHGMELDKAATLFSRRLDQDLADEKERERVAKEKFLASRRQARDLAQQRMAALLEGRL